MINSMTTHLGRLKLQLHHYSPFTAIKTFLELHSSNVRALQEQFEAEIQKELDAANLEIEEVFGDRVPFPPFLHF